ncbi:beta-ketoacyl synthase domain-containing protein [Apiospora kogelbergensis]|uniref:Beta-ketoacyl synthase domain-containing protein n=1 Tax=Apiospora kogelbergensis TaxID=1337665 RepID=A0AAW0R619_9PEZI
MYTPGQPEPIAIVGTSCRFTGGATSPSKLWDLLADPTDLTRQVPRDRFHAEAFYHADGEHHGTTNSIRAYWLDQDIRKFDAGFFNITPREAEAIDPQQRLLLEVVYEAMEAAGYSMARLTGADVAVFAGVMTADYDTLSQRDEMAASQYYATGNARSIIANRISYFFNFRGPSLTIDTACSSSLVALHQAVLSLRAHESRMACVTGVNLMLTPEQFIVESNLHMLSPSGRCHMWDVDADGYARGEGVAAVFIKTLSQALADGDRIEGIIRNTGVGSDGRTQGITMPNSEAQASLIMQTYAKAGLDPKLAEDRCQYFEAHGTGTQAGDPREAKAIEEAFFDTASGVQEPVDSDTLLVGSVKTVIGHTEGAAGLAGVLKVLQAMKHGSVPPNLHFRSLNPSVKPFYKHLQIPTAVRPWPETLGYLPRRASVNSFGFGGTNAHAIIESYVPRIHDVMSLYHSQPLAKSPSLPLDIEASDASGYFPFVVSAASQTSLRSVMRDLVQYLKQSPNTTPQQLGSHLYSKRTTLSYRLAFSAESSSNAIALMESSLKASTGANDFGIRAQTLHQKPRILGVFTGQGAQWATMSRSLLLSNRTYRDTISSLDKFLQACPEPPSWTLSEQIMAGPEVSRINEAAISQPLCTALQIALVDVLKSYGVEFHTVVGHSSGEIAAAYTAGQLSGRDAILISYYRGMFAHLAGGPNGEKGGMMAVGLSEAEAFDFCQRPDFGGGLCVAASNAPSSVTLSGDLDMVHLARDKLTQQQRFARVLVVDTAYHSPHMIQPAAAYVKALQSCGINSLAHGNGVNWISSVNGFSGAGNTDPTITYWKDNMVSAVQFHDAIKTAISEYGPSDCAIEVGPHPALKGPATQTAKSLNGGALLYSGVLDRTKNDQSALSELLGFLWSHFGPESVQLAPIFGSNSVKGALENLPSYPWDHSQGHWRESRLSRQYHFKKGSPHELLGVRTRDDCEFGLRWRNILTITHVPWIRHHSFQGQPLVPASAYCVMALDAARALIADRPASVIDIVNMQIMAGIAVEPDSAGVEVMFSLTPRTQPKDWKSSSIIEADIMLVSCAADGSTSMTKNMSGVLRIHLGEQSAGALPSKERPLSETLPASSKAFYSMMDNSSLVYSGPFRALESIERRLDYSTVSVKRSHQDDTTSLAVSPATLDTCFQSAFLTYSAPGDGSLWTSFLPTSIKRLSFNMAYCNGANVAGKEQRLKVDSSLAEARPTSSASKAQFIVDIDISNEKLGCEIQVEGLVVTAIADTRPEDDYELYLNTVFNVDPVDEIVQAPTLMSKIDPVLFDSCNQVGAFFYDQPKQQLVPIREIGLESEHSIKEKLDLARLESIEQFIEESPYRAALDFIMEVGLALPAMLRSAVPLVIDQAHRQNWFNSHLERIMEQITHRFPRLNVLSLVDPDLGLIERIVSGLGTSFSSHTIRFESGREKLRLRDTGSSVLKKTRFVSNSLRDILEDQSITGARGNLVVVSTSQLDGDNPEITLDSIRASMTAGGILILTHSLEMGVRDSLRSMAARNDHPADPISTPIWADVLDGLSGYVKTAKHADQYFACGSSIHVRQVSSPMSAASGPAIDEVLIIGGLGEESTKINRELMCELSQDSRKITTAPSFDDLDPKSTTAFTAAVVLADLDEPLLANVNDQRLSQLQAFFRPNTTVLWVTKGARLGNPDHAATLGFTRTMIAEVPNLRLQVIDLDDLEGAAERISGCLRQMCLPDTSIPAELNPKEPEVYIEKGQRLIPRVKSLKPFNDRINASRRVMSPSVNPIVEENLFRPDATYLLVGLTRDLGQSLCRLFIRHGARHIVLASRNPDMALLKWTNEVSAHIAVERLDVTNLADVRALQHRLRAAGAAPLAGVVNGAMVLEDRVFAQMESAATWNRVMAPKTVGSANLDAVFGQDELDFFVMTSSFAAVGGHPGQANYAAANMYMNGLAARRRLREGRVGSVLNIGVIYGLGLLQREKGELYAGLEREGYPPISERDIHHMFLEAIVAGRPPSGEGKLPPFDITTGLKRFKWGSAEPLHWHLDPRFSHFTVDDDESDSSSSAAGHTPQETLPQTLEALSEPSMIANSILAAFTDRLEAMLGLQNVNPQNSVVELGIDSLASVEIRNWFWKTLGRDVAILKILGAASLQKRK